MHVATVNFGGGHDRHVLEPGVIERLAGERGIVTGAAVVAVFRQRRRRGGSLFRVFNEVMEDLTDIYLCGIADVVVDIPFSDGDRLLAGHREDL